MAETPHRPDLPDNAAIPSAVAARKRKWSLPLVWLVPIVAALAGGWLAVQAILNQGPTITISFESAHGIEAGKTQIKYKEVQIGLVTGVALSEDRTRVIVTAEMTKQAEDFITEDARFWVVSPRVSLSSVSGLGTLFSGVYIGMAAGKSTTRHTAFTGLEIPPVLTSDQPGRSFVLKSESMGSLDVGAGVYFRQTPVGQVVALELDKDGNGVSIQVFVNSPYDQFVKTRTRFWEASGLDVSLTASGLQVNTESFVAMLVGGIAFGTSADAQNASTANAGSTFRLHPNRSDAFKQPDTSVQRFRFLFRESVRGLAVGAPVDFRGINIGEVVAIGVEFDAKARQILMVVDVDIYAERLSSRYIGGEKATPMSGPERMQAMLEGGLRAQLQTGNLLTGQLFVALDFFPGAPRFKPDLTRQPIVVPTVPSAMNSLQDSLASILKKVDQMPLDELVVDLRQAIRSLDKTLKDVSELSTTFNAEVTPELRAAVIEGKRAMSSAQSVLESESPLQNDLRNALREIARAAESLRILADTLERRPEALIRGK